MYSKQESPPPCPAIKGSVWAFVEDMQSQSWDHTKVMVESFSPVLDQGALARKKISLGDSDLAYDPTYDSASLHQNSLKLVCLKLGYTLELPRELNKLMAGSHPQRL